MAEEEDVEFNFLISTSRMQLRMEQFSQSSSWTLSEDFRQQKGQTNKQTNKPLQPDRMKERKKEKRNSEKDQQEAEDEESPLTQ